MADDLNLRKLEKSVLAQLQLNSRQTYSQIGKKLHTSQQQVSYTINSLLRKGILQNTLTHIDYARLGVMIFGVFFRVHYTSEASHNRLLDSLVKDRHTAWVATCGGRYDIVTAFFTRNPSMFNDVLRKITEKHSKQLRNYSVLTWVIRRGFSRKYFFRLANYADEATIGGDHDLVDMDNTDLIILNELSNNTRASSVQIASKLNLTPKTIIGRIRRLEKLKVIIGYKALLNMRKIGHSSRLLLIRYHNVTAQLEDKFIAYLRSHPNVLSLVKTLGEWDVEVEVEAHDFWELRKVEMKLREEFAELIQDVEGVPLYQTHKRTFFPEFFIEA